MSAQWPPNLLTRARIELVEPDSDDERAVQYAREDRDLATERLQGLMDLQVRMDASQATENE